MNRVLCAATIAAILLAPLSAKAVSPEKTTSYRDGGVVLRFDGPMGSVLNPGEEVGFTFQTRENAYVIVFNIDTEGFVNLLYPAPGAIRMTRARETVRLPESAGETWLAEGDTGIEFVFAMTVPSREFIDESELEFLARSETLPRSERYRIDGDPFLAANIIAGELVRGISHRQGIFLDYTYFFINERVSQPCYLCGDCEGETPDGSCEGLEIAADFDRSSPLVYPLRRAYAMREETGLSADDYGVAMGEETSDDDFQPARVDITFYPYRSEVYYDTRSVLYDRDFDYYLYVWDPWWYDPWACGWVYYPTHRWGWYHYPYGSYYSWSFNWGWYGGYYCSSWYYPRYRDFHDYYWNDYYAYRHDRHRSPYKYKYKREHETAKYTGTTFAHARARSVQRDGRLKVASSNVKGAYRNITTARRSGVKVAHARKYSSLRGAKDRATYRRYTKTTKVRNAHSYIGSKMRSSSNRGYEVRRSRSSRSTGSRAKARGSTRTRSSGAKARGSSRSRSHKSNYKPPSRSSSSKSSKSRYSGSQRRSTSSKGRSSGKSSSYKRSSSGSRAKSSGRSSSGRSSSKSRSGGKSKRK